MALDDVLHQFQVEPRHAREESRGLTKVLGVLAQDGDREGVTVLDEHLAVAVEQDPTRRAQRERALMVVLRHLLVLVVLSDLQDPETHAERGKRHDHGDLEYDQSLADSPAIFTRRRIEPPTAYRLLPTSDQPLIRRVHRTGPGLRVPTNPAAVVPHAAARSRLEA